MSAAQQGRLGEWPRPELRKHGRVSTACYDAAQGHIPHLTIYGTDFKVGGCFAPALGCLGPEA